MPDRLPEISAALILETVGLEVFRDKFGMQECLEYGIGPMREKLGPAPVFFAPPFATEALPLTMPEAMELARDEARAVLAGMCRVCPFKHCGMKDWGATP